MTAILPAAKHSGQRVPEPLSQTHADWPSLSFRMRLASILFEERSRQILVKEGDFEA